MTRKKSGNGLEPPAPTLAQSDRFLQESLGTARAQMDRCVTEITSYAQRSPEKALVSALVGGYLLRMLPLTRILGGVIRLGLMLLKPAAFIYGAVKVGQKIQGVADRRDDRNGR